MYVSNIYDFINIICTSNQDNSCSQFSPHLKIWIKGSHF